MVRSRQARANRREGVKLLCHNGLESELHSAPLERSRKEREKVMAAERGQNLQDTFLNYVRKNKVPLTVCRGNGVKVQRVVTWFDNFCLLLRLDGHAQLVYKHAISTIMPGHPIQLFEGADEPPAGDKV